MGHLRDDDLLRYLTGDTSEEENMLMDAHFSQCNLCAGRMNALFYLGNHFDTLWESWSAKEHGETYRNWRMLNALVDASRTSILPAGLINRWTAALGMQIDMTARFFISGVRKIVAITAEFAANYRFQSQPVSWGVGTPEALENEAGIAQGESLLFEGQTESAMKLLGKATASNACLLQARVMDVYGGNGKLKARLTVDARKHKAALHYWPCGEKDVPGMAILSAKNASAGTTVSAFKKNPSDSCYLAEFSKLPDGEYDVYVLKSNE
jgi:hypothetical protein